MTTNTPVTDDQPQASNAMPLGQARALMQGIREKLGEGAFGCMTKWLGLELERDQYARLEQAGDHAEHNRIALARVFVDLSVSSTPFEERDNETTNVFGMRFLQYCCKPSSDRSERLAEQPEHTSASGDIYEPERKESRLDGVTLVGGPGQGKSTLGQLLCQLHRAWLLESIGDDLTDESQEKIVHAFTQESEGKDLEIPAEIAFPIRIVLPDAAAWLSEQNGSSIETVAPRLLQYVASVAQKRGIGLDATDLALVVRNFRTVLVLDGLDEVIAIEDRQRLIEVVKALFADALLESSSFVVVTTRPQGYADEFDFPKLHLITLGRDHALQYARRLVDARFQDDRRDIVYRRLEEAASNETTARLMRSPLQITIMATLVAALGRAPNERWTLFKEYYRVIYEREMEKSSEAAQLLSDYRRCIDKIHTQVGLLLQIEAEHSGGTASKMSQARFRQVVNAVLAADDIDGAERDEIAQKLIGEKGDRAAGLMKVMGHRLVLLVEETPGNINFEVRSIQEFMAAWALSLKDEKTVERRMWRIVKAGSFRHVLLFLASRAFTDLDLQGLRDALVDRICPELNEAKDDPLARATLAGSMLALEILDEGSALKQPKYVKKLAQLAVRFVELPPSPTHARLVRVLLRDPDVMRVSQSIVESAIVERLGQSAPEDRLGAWVILLDLAAQGQSWAQRLAEARWNESAAKVGKSLGYALENAEIAPRDWLGEFLGGRLVYLDATSLHIWLRAARFDAQRRRYLGSLGPLQAFFALLSQPKHKDIRVLLYGEKSPSSLRIVTIAQDTDLNFGEFAERANGYSKFALIVAAARFILDPTAATLAAQVEYVADHFDIEAIDQFAKQVPWPLAACLNVAKSPDALRELAQRVRHGELGNTAEWLTAERRWLTSKSIPFAEAIHFDDDASPWPRNIAAFGFPVLGARINWVFYMTTTPISWNPMLALLRATLSHTIGKTQAKVVAHWFMQGLRDFITGDDFFIQDFRGRRRPITTENMHGKIPDDFAADEAQRISDLTGVYRLDVFAAMQPWKGQDPAWIELLDRAGRSDRVFVEEAPLEEFSAYASRCFNENPSRSGLLRVLRLCAQCGSMTSVDRTLWKTNPLASETVQEDVYMLRLAQGDIDVDEAVEGAKVIAHASGGPRYPMGVAFEVLKHVSDNADYVLPTLLALLEHAPPLMFSWRSQIIERLRRIASSRPTHLDDDEVWTDLALPLPRPFRKTSLSKLPPLVAREPVRIESIHLENVRTIKTLEIEPSPPHNGSGQWIVLVGENGTGKTTILRSIVLALRRIGTLPDTAHKPSFRRVGMEREENCTVDVRIGGKTYAVRVDVDKKGLDNPVRDGGDHELSAQFPLFAYGARRGSALGGANPTVDFDSPKEIETLFREGAWTNHAEGWLIPIYLRARGTAENSPQKHKWEAVQSVLFALLPGLKKIEVDDVDANRIWFEGEGIDRTTILGLSDGYLMTLGWIVDLLSRYVYTMDQRKEPIATNFHENMTGLVIIDEPDEFLHPAWQRNLISKVREVFPKMSFVMTTHNPLTLLGARAEEIWLLDRRGGELIPVQGRETPALMTGSDLYDAYFGIESVFPDELGQWLDRYGFLARNPVRTDDEHTEAIQLLEALRAKGVDPGFEPIPRVSLSVDSGS